MPLHLRRWVASVSYVPASQGHAYTSAGHITFFGTFGFDVLVHESTHAQDQGFSGSKAYLQAIGSDPCVPDDYAQTNNVECYAQDMVVFLYKLWRPYDQPLGTKCMAKQLKAVNSSQAPDLQAYITSTGVHVQLQSYTACIQWHACRWLSPSLDQQGLLCQSATLLVLIT